MSLTALKEQLADVLESARPGTPSLATGLEALDAALPGGGIPRGRLTEVLGRRGSGKTTFVRRLVESVIGAGLAVAYVDARRTLAAVDWCGVGGPGSGVRKSMMSFLGERPSSPSAMSRPRTPAPGSRPPDSLFVIRPHADTKAPWCADVLLRSGAFALVVLDGAPPISRSVAVRLTRLARDADAALVVVGDVEEGERMARPTMLGGALRLRVESEHARRHRRGRAVAEDPGRGERGERRFVVAVEKGGHQRRVEVSCAIGVARRLCTHSEVPDRRGVAKRPAGGSAGRGSPAAPASAVAGRAHARRCAEPDFGRPSPGRSIVGAPVARPLRAPHCAAQ